MAEPVTGLKRRSARPNQARPRYWGRVKSGMKKR